MNGLKHYSYVLLSVILIALSTATVIWYRWGQEGAIVILVMIAALILFWVLSRRAIPTPSSPEKRIRRARGNSRPVVVYFYTDYNLRCLLARLLSARAEREYRSRCDFIFINMSHREAWEAAATVEADLGQYVLIDASGKVVQRSWYLSAGTLENVVAQPSH